MIKRKIFHGALWSTAALEQFEDGVQKFVMDEISKEEHTIVKYITTVYGKDTDRIRTEIIYRAHPTRKVITEKTKDAQN